VDAPVVEDVITDVAGGGGQQNEEEEVTKGHEQAGVLWGQRQEKMVRHTWFGHEREVRLQESWVTFVETQFQPKDSGRKPGWPGP
jgi:hypothetical protein